MKIVVIGLGSMGKRRIRLLKKRNNQDIIIGIDARDDRRSEVRDIYDMETYESLDDAVKNHPDISCALICTSPLSHNKIIHNCLLNGLHVFTEINLVADGYEENIKLALENNLKMFLSSTFLYREEICYLSKNISRITGKINYIYHVGQYLPDWHPWEKYNDFFVGDERTNGCREIMAIEFPWIIETFGAVKNFHVISDKMSGLNIHYNDNYMIQLEHENGNKGILVVDVVSPRAVRNLEVYAENEYFSWDGTPEGLNHYEDGKLIPIELYEVVDKMESYSSFVIENAYANELQEFFEVIEGKREQRYGFEKDLDTLMLLDRIEGKI